jgi:sigma-B regulation protein RsbU (phosphoserine phosphatase)
MQHTHAAAQASDHCLDLDDVARVNGAAIPDAFDAGEEREALAVLWLRENHDCADLSDRLRQDRRGQHGRFAVAARQIAFVQRHVLDADDAFVDFQLDDAIDEQKRVPVRQDSLDRAVIERKLQGIHEHASIIGRRHRMPHGSPPGEFQPVTETTGSAREQEMLTTLFDLGRQVTGVLDLEELLTQIPRFIRRLIAFDAFAVYLLDERRGELRVAYSVGYAEGDQPMRLRLGEGLVGAAVASQTPLLVNDVSQDPRYVNVVSGMSSELVVPLLHKARSIGALNVLSHRKDQFSASDVAVLRQFGAHVAVGLVNARLYEQSRSDAEAFETLAEIGRDVASVLDLDELFARIAQLVRRAIDYRTLGILLLNEERGDLEMKVAVQYGEKVELPRVRLGEGLVGYAALHKEPVLVPDVSQDPRYIRLVPDVRSELVIPMLLKDRCIGVFDLESPELDAFTKRDVEILTLLASQAAVAIENARLYEAVRVNEVRLEKEVRFAQRVQAALLPTGLPKRLRGVEVAASFVPARELGGDFHDFLSPESHTLVVALGDVSGKGVPAALYSVFAAELVRGRTFRRRYLPDRSTPASVLSSVNTILHQRQLEEYYCTLCYTVFDLKRRVVTLANSGLPYPIRASGEEVLQIESPGVPLGSFPGTSYDELTFALHTGDLFVFCSDGVFEAMDSAGQEFTAARLLDVVSQARTQPPREVVAKIFAAVEEFRAGAQPNDDMTAVAVRITG